MQYSLDLSESEENSITESKIQDGVKITYRVGEFWTNRQRQANAIHEISYRACFKPQLPDYFILKYTKPGDVVYDPFGGRGTTTVQAAIRGRKVIHNDVNPLSALLTSPRLAVPSLSEIESRLQDIDFRSLHESDIDLTMFYHEKTLQEILSLREYFARRRVEGQFDAIDSWLSMVATNRLTGHSTGFFSVYSFPPNLAVSQKSQERINRQRNQVPPYRNTSQIIMKKSKSLQSELNTEIRHNLQEAYRSAKFYSYPANLSGEIPSNHVSLTVTSPPFLDIVQYSEDNWLRCWFNSIDTEEVSTKITMTRDPEVWGKYMMSVLQELYRLTKPNGYVAFEVGEVRNQSIYLDEVIVPIARRVGFSVSEVMINSQSFTKTSNLWGVKNNKSGTNTNRIVVLNKS